MTHVMERLQWSEWTIEAAHKELMARMPERLNSKEQAQIERLIGMLRHMQKVSEARKVA